MQLIVKNNSMERYRSAFGQICILVEGRLRQCLPNYLQNEILKIVEDVVSINTSLKSSHGSKRLRGVLFWEIHSLSGCNDDNCYNIAASLELVHIASLIIDDLQDGHEERWARPTLWTKIGKAEAINIAFFLFVVAEQIVDEADRGVSSTINNTIKRMLMGQFEDLRSKQHFCNCLKDYIEMVRGKTAALLECAADLGGHGFNEYNRNLLKEYAMILGTAHQIQDDIDDLRNASKMDEISGSNVMWYLEDAADMKRDERINNALSFADYYVEQGINLLKNSKLNSKLIISLNLLLEILGTRGRKF